MPKRKKMIKFHDGRVTCFNAPLRTILWEYICWVLGGKPDSTYDCIDYPFNTEFGGGGKTWEEMIEIDKKNVDSYR